MASGRCSSGRAEVGSSCIFCSLTFQLSWPALGKAESSDVFLIAAFQLDKTTPKANLEPFQDHCLWWRCCQSHWTTADMKMKISEHLFCTAPSLGGEKSTQVSREGAEQKLLVSGWIHNSPFFLHCLVFDFLTQKSLISGTENSPVTAQEC